MHLNHHHFVPFSIPRCLSGLPLVSKCHQVSVSMSRACMSQGPLKSHNVLQLIPWSPTDGGLPEALSHLHGNVCLLCLLPQRQTLKQDMFRILRAPPESQSSAGPQECKCDWQFPPAHSRACGSSVKKALSLASQPGSALFVPIPA